VSVWTILYLLAGAATVYPYYRFAIKPRTRREREQGMKERSWRELDPIFFPLITIIMWPVALLTVGIALYAQRSERLAAAGD